MARIAAALLSALLLLIAADAALPLLVTGARSADRIDHERIETFRRVVFRNLEEANQNVNERIARIHRQYRAIPNGVAPQELRVFLIGNSAALFAIVPEVLEAALVASHPERSVRLVPMLIPDISVAEEQILTRAALRKNADVVILTPNLKGLIEGHEVRVRRVRELFGKPKGFLVSPVAVARTQLRRHWETYALRDELRPALLGLLEGWLPLPSPRARERRILEAGFAAVRRGAERGDVGAVLAAYRSHQLTTFVPTAIESRPLARNSPIFHTIARTASAVRTRGVRGVAVFLPVNPLFRDPVATADHPEVRVDDAYTRALARHTLLVYRSAGFVTSNQLDALDATAFIDLVHPNAAGTRTFSNIAGDAIADALAP